MHIKNFFRDKKQVDQAKTLPIPDAEKIVTSHLKLSRLRIEYNCGLTEPYQVHIDYAERPTDWSNHGIIDQKTIKAESWPELVDMVIAHFEGDGKETPDA